jgi:membrane associated rhomboid family serine protease
MEFPIPVTPLPFNVDRKLKRIPYATYTILGINIIIFVFYWFMVFWNAFSGNDVGFFAETFRRNNAFVFAEPNLLALFMHAFMHVDFFHILGNMLLLWLVGKVLEDSIGTPLFVLFYFTSLLVALLINWGITAAFVPSHMQYYNLGASGAVSGVLGLAAFRNYRLKVRTIPLLFGLIPIWKPFWLPYWSFAAYFALSETWDGLAEIITGRSGGVAHWAHIGGLIMGVLAAFMFRSAQDEQYDYAMEDASKAVAGKASQSATKQNLERLNRERPDDPGVLEGLAKLHTAQGQIDDARGSYIKAIHAYLRQHENQRAADAYMNMVLTLPPTTLDPRLQIGVGNALEAIARYQDALMAYEEVIENHPASDEAQTALLRGAQLRMRHLNDPIRAEWMLRMLIEDHPASPWVPMARQRLQELGKTP